MEWVVPIWRASWCWPTPVTIFFSGETPTVTIAAVSSGRNILACWNHYKHIFNQNFQLFVSTKRFFKLRFKNLVVLHHIGNTNICQLCLVHKVAHLIGFKLSFMMFSLVSLSRALKILKLKSDNFSFCSVCSFVGFQVFCSYPTFSNWITIKFSQFWIDVCPIMLLSASPL